MNIRDTAAIPAHISKLMSESDRQAIGEVAELPSESAAKFERRAEKEMHEQFINWCRLNEIEFVHGRMDKPSTIEKGWPDFTCLKGHQFCLVEMKVPGAHLTKEQVEVIARIRLREIPVLVAYSVKDAIDFCRERLL